MLNNKVRKGQRMNGTGCNGAKNPGLMLTAVLVLAFMTLSFMLSVGASAQSNTAGSTYALPAADIMYVGGAGGESVHTAVRTQGDYEKFRNTEVYAGGVPFGIKFTTNGVVVVGFCDINNDNQRLNPASDAGIRLKDVIVAVDGNRIGGAEELTALVEKSAGKAMTFRIKRSDGELDVSVTPAFSKNDGKYKTGIWVKDNGAGIGTVTFITSDGMFGGLGHGICDGESGALVDMRSGIVTDVTVSGIIKGLQGTPGEIKGYFTSGKKGTLLENTDCGIFGIYGELPKICTDKIRVGVRDELHNGKVKIRCTLDDNVTNDYDAEISDIDTSANGNKCFTIHITDPRLIERTGGIVQGMSGSPIIQDGKLVGAVTHVLINDPRTGYGIFIDNMLAEMSEDRK